MYRKVVQRKNEMLLVMVDACWKESFLTCKIFSSGDFFRCLLIPDLLDGFGVDGEGITPTEACDMAKMEYVSITGNKALADVVISESLDSIEE